MESVRQSLVNNAIMKHPFISYVQRRYTSALFSWHSRIATANFLLLPGDCCVGFVKAIMDEVLIKVFYCTSMCLELLLYSFNMQQG